MGNQSGSHVMSIWGKVIGGVAGFAVAGPLGALLGAAAGHAVDRAKQRGGGAVRQDAVSQDEAHQVAFTIAIIVLSAKMAKADGVVTSNEVAAFKQVFNIPPSEMANVGRLFDEARADAQGFEPYAEQIAGMFAGRPAVLEELLGGLFHIAKADGAVDQAELDYLSRVAAIFGFDSRAFERIRTVRLGTGDANPYAVLGLKPEASDSDLKKTYHRLSREYHPDTLIAQGMPQEFIDLANEKMAAINAAHDSIRKHRGQT